MKRLIIILILLVFNLSRIVNATPTDVTNRANLNIPDIQKAIFILTSSSLTSTIDSYVTWKIASGYNVFFNN